MNALAKAKTDFRTQIQAAEEIILACPQVDLPVKHHFCNGVYAREMFIPAGTVLTGAIHKTQHLCIVSAGIIQVADESGSRQITAPATFVSQPGAKRIGIAMTDTVFITIHATDKTDVVDLERELVATTYAEYDQHVALSLDHLQEDAA